MLGWRLVELVAIINNGMRRFREAALLVIIGSALRTLAALLFYVQGQTTLTVWAFAYLGATLLSALLAFLIFMPKVRLAFVPALYPRRMADALSAGAADILF